MSGMAWVLSPATVGLASLKNGLMHPANGAGDSTPKEISMSNKAKANQSNPKDRQAPLSGKVENDFNKQGEQKPTQKNEGRRTPESRHDRETQVGSQNQTQARKGAGGIGH
jgi:hypothetical protein